MGSRLSDCKSLLAPKRQVCLICLPLAAGINSGAVFHTMCNGGEKADAEGLARRKRRRQDGIC